MNNPYQISEKRSDNILFLKYIRLVYYDLFHSKVYCDFSDFFRGRGGTYQVNLNSNAVLQKNVKEIQRINIY